MKRLPRRTGDHSTGPAWHGRRTACALHWAAALLTVGAWLTPSVFAEEDQDRARKPATPRGFQTDSATKGGTRRATPPDRLVPGSTKVDPVRQAAWEAANTQAKNRVADFENALKTKNPDRIRKAALDLQSDPLAVQHLNNGGRADLIGVHNAETGAIKEAAKRNIQQEMADKWNAAHPNDKITAADVTIKEPTNYRAPDARQRVGQDWDVTVQVRGKDVPTSMSKSVVEDSFFKAAGGEKTFGKGMTPSEAAQRQAVEVTDSKSLESYKEPDKILGRDGQAPDHGERLQNPEDMGDVIEYKSNHAANKAEAARKGGNQVEGVRQDYEQMRQAVKQYDKVTDPRVKGQGGKVGNQVEKGIEVMREVADMKISPEEGRARLAEMGETPDSITRKAAGQIEAAQKLKPPDAPKTAAPDAPKAATPDAPKPTAPDAPKATAPDAPKAAVPDAPKAAVPDAPKATAPDAPKATAPDAPKAATPDAPKATAPDAPKAAAPDAPKAAVPDAPKATAPDAPKAAVPDTPKAVAPDAPKAVAPDAPKATTPDAPKAAAPDAPKAAAPDAPKAAAPDAPKVTTPDVPSGKAGKAMKVGGKVMQGVGAVGDALDIFGGAQDFTEAAEKGDVEGMKEAAVNMGDALTGGGYGTTKLVKGRAQDGGEYAAEVEGLDRGAMENLHRSQVELDLRRADYSKEEADKMVSDMVAGNDAAVKSAYEKMGKEMPERETAGVSSFGEAVEIYGAEVKENIGEVGTGIKTGAIKAGKFLKGTAENLGEMAVGVVTESGVASELAEQVGRNVSAGNLKEGYDAWQQSKAADEQVADARQQLEDKLVAGGARRTEASEAADSFYGIGTESGQPDSAKTRALITKIRERKEKAALRGAEPEAGGDEQTEDRGEDGGNGGLESYAKKRTARTETRAGDGYGLAADGRNIQEASTRGELAEAEARRIVETAGGDAQATQERTAAVAAAEFKATSLGKAVADGLQMGVESGAAAFGGELGGAAGKKLGDQIFEDPHKDRHGGGKGGGDGGEVGEQVADGGGRGDAPEGSGAKGGSGKDGKGGDAVAKQGKEPGKAPEKAADAEKPAAQSASGGMVAKCPKCGGTKFGPEETIYQTRTSIGRDRRCLTCGHMGGVYVNEGAKPAAAGAPVTQPQATPAAASAPTKPKSSDAKSAKKEPPGTLVRCTTPGCPNGMRVLMGDIPKNYICEKCFMKKYTAQQEAAGKGK